MQRYGSDDTAVVAQEVDDTEVSGLADTIGPVHHSPQRFRHCWPSVEKVHVDSARTIVAGSHDLRDTPIFACPANAPIVHRANALRPLLT